MPRIVPSSMIRNVKILPIVKRNKKWKNGDGYLKFAGKLNKTSINYVFTPVNEWLQIRIKRSRVQARIFRGVLYFHDSVFDHYGIFLLEIEPMQL